MHTGVNLLYGPTTPSTAVRANHPLHGSYSPLCYHSRGTLFHLPSSRRDGAQRHHDMMDMPPSRRSDRSWCKGRSMTVVPYLSAHARLPTDGTRRIGTECDGHSVRQDLDGGRPRTPTDRADDPG
jgi:hypothetical protein